MDAGPQLPRWFRPGQVELRDVWFLAVDLAEHRSQEAAGISAVIQWLLGESAGPATGRTDGPARRDVAVVELAAAEQSVDDGPAPALHEVCQHYEVTYWPPLPLDVRFARGVWLGLRWALGEASRPPLDIPIRRPDGSLLGEAEIYEKLVACGRDRTAARRDAMVLAAGSRQLAALVDRTAARFG